MIQYMIAFKQKEEKKNSKSNTKYYFPFPTLQLTSSAGYISQALLTVSIVGAVRIWAPAPG